MFIKFPNWLKVTVFIGAIIIFASAYYIIYNIQLFLEGYNF